MGAIHFLVFSCDAFVPRGAAIIKEIDAFGVSPTQFLTRNLSVIDCSELTGDIHLMYVLALILYFDTKTFFRISSLKSRHNFDICFDYNFAL